MPDVLRFPRGAIWTIVWTIRAIQILEAILVLHNCQTLQVQRTVHTRCLVRVLQTIQVSRDMHTVLGVWVEAVSLSVVRDRAKML